MKQNTPTTPQKKFAGRHVPRDTAGWCTLIDRQYPTIEWASEVHSDHLPSPVLHMQLCHKKYLMGLIQKTVTRVLLLQDRQELDTETLFQALGLALQGHSYLRSRHKTLKDKTIIRGPRSELSAMRVLLKADIFASLLLYGSGDTDAIARRARRRAEALLIGRHGVDPSLYALPLATGTIELVLPTLSQTSHILDYIFINEVLARTEDVSRCIDQSALSDWYGFGQAAQDMAWRKISKRSILGTAFLSDMPTIRTLALTISDLTGLMPHGADQLDGTYSAFVDDTHNERAHHHAMNEEFEWIMAQDPVKNGSHVFLQAADRQIDNLQKGQVVGWCADALHCSAKAFDDQGGNSQQALIAAREAFEEHKNDNTWDQLQRLGEQIVDVCRKGLLMDVRELYTLATGHDLGGLRNALDAHMMVNEPSAHTKHLAPLFSSPALYAPAPATPIYAPVITRHMAPVLGLGGGGSGSERYTNHNQDEDAAIVA